jgi:hypothetical protein
MSCRISGVVISADLAGEGYQRESFVLCVVVTNPTGLQVGSGQSPLMWYPYALMSPCHLSLPAASTYFQRLHLCTGEFAALKEALGDSTSGEGESGKQIVMNLLSKIATLQVCASS